MENPVLRATQAGAVLQTALTFTEAQLLSSTKKEGQVVCLTKMVSVESNANKPMHLRVIRLLKEQLYRLERYKSHGLLRKRPCDSQVRPQLAKGASGETPKMLSAASSQTQRR